jgi:hypothetical protein
MPMTGIDNNTRIAIKSLLISVAVLIYIFSQRRKIALAIRKFYKKMSKPIIINFVFEDNFCDLSNSDFDLADVVENIKRIADEDKDIWTDIIVKSGDVCSSVVGIGKDSLDRINELYKLSAYIPEEIRKKYEANGWSLNYTDICYKENKFASGKHRVLSVSRQISPSGKDIHYEILCEQ